MAHPAIHSPLIPRRIFFALLVIALAVGPLACGSKRPPKTKTVSFTPTEEFLKKTRDPWAAYLAYREALSGGDVNRAAAFLDLARERDPHSQHLLMEEATLAAARNEFGRAETLAKDAARRESTNPRPYALLGRIAANQNFHLEAVEWYETALAKGVRDASVYTLLIQEYLNLRDIEKALQVAETLIAAFPSEVDGYFYIGFIYDQYLDKPDAALKAYHQVMLSKPRDLLVLDRVAAIYLEKRDYVSALRYLEKIRETAPDDPATLLRIALIYHDSGRKAEAAGILEDILKSQPDADRVHYYLGIFSLEDGDYRKARRHLERVPEASSYFEDAAAKRILAYTKEKNWREAEALAQWAAAKFKKNFIFYGLLIGIEESKENFSVAEAQIEAAREQFGKEVDYHYTVALYWERRGEWKRAIAAMREVLVIDPNHVGALNYIGYTYADRGENLEEALAFLIKAHALDPDNAYVTDSLGWVYYRSNELALAKRYIEEALKKEPDEPVILGHLGDLYLALGNRTKAEEFFRRSLELLKREPDPSREETAMRDHVQAALLGLANHGK